MLDRILQLRQALKKQSEASEVKRQLTNIDGRQVDNARKKNIITTHEPTAPEFPKIDDSQRLRVRRICHNPSTKELRHNQP